MSILLEQRFFLLQLSECLGDLRLFCFFLDLWHGQLLNLWLGNGSGLGRFDRGGHVFLVFGIEVELLDRAVLDFETLEACSRLRVPVNNVYLSMTSR